ncbi:WSC domain-containing protein 1 isoform X2 [Notothenia coriiceps]|uniref:WSC domain-containing protein 1 isoform X2 n=1 Tax=Notothenia coriiceps TaxID=8208 RepID=A0A6I9N502_9TELE|nr:PREDICTED: WSC domain-containing protein 1 isoform X2 [Notothenia coriiceps]
MLAPPCRLYCLLKRAQMLLLGLGIAYLMAGSILLLQRSSIRVTQPNLASLPPLLSLAAPPTALRTAGLGVRTRSRWASVQPQSGGGAKATRHWPASQRLGVQHLHRRWFHSLLPESPEQRAPLHSRHKGTYIGCFLHNASDRALGGTMLYDLRKMTSSLCQDTCSESLQVWSTELSATVGTGSVARGLRRRTVVWCVGGRGGLPVEVWADSPFTRWRSSCQVTESELPLAVFKKPHCFCSWASSLFSLNQQCVGDTGLNHTSNSTHPTAPKLDHYQVYHTPVLDSRCKERMFLPQRSSSLVALSSFPGAGNTWVRHLIELVTGYYTGSFYFDGTLYNRGFKGEKDYWKSGRSISVKTHESGQKEIEMFDSAILLIRNPYRSLMAEFNRKCAGHLGHATDVQLKSKEWPEFVSSYAPWWASHALSWLRFGRRLLVVHYEELQMALVPQLRLITAFLNVSMTEERLFCAQGNQDGHFKRSGGQRPSFDPFTPDMRHMIDPFILTVDQALKGRNFSGVPQEYLPR